MAGSLAGKGLLRGLPSCSCRQLGPLSGLRPCRAGAAARHSTSAHVSGPTSPYEPLPAVRLGVNAVIGTPWRRLDTYYICPVACPTSQGALHACRLRACRNDPGGSRFHFCSRRAGFTCCIRDAALDTMAGAHSERRATWSGLLTLLLQAVAHAGGAAAHKRACPKTTPAFLTGSHGPGSAFSFSFVG